MNPQDPSSPITVLLRRSSAGDHQAEEQLFELVYERLRDIAGRAHAGERQGHTLQPTALVHETFLRLLGKGQVTWQDRAHFFAVASRTMRRILVDHARKYLAEKGGGGRVSVELKDQLDYGPSPESARLVTSLHDSLDELAKHDKRQSEIVEMRFFGGLTEEEIALLLGISTRTVKRDWEEARKWLETAIAG